jgi:hypothetical protein
MTSQRKQERLHRRLPVQLAAATRPRDRCLFLLMFRHRPHLSEVCGLTPQTAIETSDGQRLLRPKMGLSVQNGFGAMTHVISMTGEPFRSMQASTKRETGCLQLNLPGKLA